ncbi:MAG TPA: class I SAM-dependent methyltransferase [Segeticoccus sp.]|uniref:class I SAM-dependent methyltransferase n=1 Tax=Segeticoccus sp. TaxID=2706531 RepID=UPI002D7FA146|nr:class I SAM-dependent methyltransferase [Segeticoccus sp.]HET8599141.1 class I SAM-dependent methyltransferase [Segeticoccus sp.]
MPTGERLRAMSRRRSSLTFKLRYAVRHPERIRGHLRRAARDAWLRASSRDHVAYYRAVMQHDVAHRAANAAVGSPSEEQWLRFGRFQFRYLRQHGLLPRHRVLEIGCGNLRAGWHLIDYLDAGNYYGIDISPDILFAAQQTVADRGLQDKLPHLTPVRDLRFAFLPDGYFDVVHAHSVFSHSPAEVVEECLAHVGRILTPDGFFDFTFNRTEAAEHHVLHEDFYYRTETLVAAAERHGLTARLMEDWEQSSHRQSKLRVTRS